MYLFYPSAFAIFFLCLAVAFGTFSVFKGNVDSQFAKIFHDKFTENNPICYGRTEFKKELKKLVGDRNPRGIVFVSGAKNAGKTTSIQSALVGRDHVAYISLREASFSSESDLAEYLKISFHITQFQDFIDSITKNLGPLRFLLGLYSIPKLTFSRDSSYSDLKAVLNDIETILKHAYYGRKSSVAISKRPVIFLDEIGNLQPMVNGNKDQRACAEVFIKWIIKVSKDEKLCDFIFSSHDGFAQQTLGLADPMYTASIIIPPYTEKELVNMARTHSKELNKKFINKIVAEVGFQGSHVIDSMKEISKPNLEKLIRSFKNNERDLVKQIMLQAEENPWFHKRGGWGSFTKNEAECIFKSFATRRNQTKADGAEDVYPSISKRTMIDGYQCPEDVIKYFSNQGWLLYDPGQQLLFPRSKIFLDEYIFETNTEYEALHIKKQLDAERKNRGCNKWTDENCFPADEEKIKDLEQKLSELK